MNKSCGIIYTAFGSEFNRLAYETIKYSSQFRECPVCVFTNIKENTFPWSSIKNLERRYIPVGNEYNRDIKTRIIEYTPFDISLYLDADTVLQKKGIESLFDLLDDDHDIGLRITHTVLTGTKVWKVYKEAMVLLEAIPPVDIYYGGFFIFKKNQKTTSFFSLWNEYWKKTGCGRDMPALACAVKKSGIKVKKIMKQDNIFTNRTDKNSLIQHDVPGFCEAFGVTPWRSNHLKDVKGMWTKVEV